MTRHRSNAPRFVDETVDGEVLIMDMVKGTYYSGQGASTAAFNALKHGATTAEIAAAFANGSALPIDEMQAELDRFADELRREEILVIESSNGNAGPSTIGAAGAFEPLQIERFDDLADLILLDPVHDVTEAGWPSEAK